MKVYLLDNNTTAKAFSKELLGDIRNRMSQVIEARGQYAVIEILEAKLTITGASQKEISYKIRDIIMNFQKDKEGQTKYIDPQLKREKSTPAQSKDTCSHLLEFSQSHSNDLKNTIPIEGLNADIIFAEKFKSIFF